MCNESSFCQFPGILTTDTHVVLNGGVYPGGNTVDDLTENNPQFWYDFGVNGVSTLHTFMIVEGTDLIMTVLRDAETITSVAIPAHPRHRLPH